VTRRLFALAPRLSLLVAIVVTIGCDRATKSLAAATLAGTPGRSFLSDTVRLVYAENAGGFLSLGADWPAPIRTMVFTAVTGLSLLVLLGLAFREREPHWSTLGWALFAAGGLSNWIDRLAHGRAVDFMNVGIGPIRTGVFNVADVAIMAGAAVVIVTGALSARRPPVDSADV
jgi:signal peptidase II